MAILAQCLHGNSFALWAEVSAGTLNGDTQKSLVLCAHICLFVYMSGQSHAWQSALAPLIWDVFQGISVSEGNLSGGDPLISFVDCEMSSGLAACANPVISWSRNWTHGFAFFVSLFDCLLQFASVLLVTVAHSVSWRQKRYIWPFYQILKELIKGLNKSHSFNQLPDIK